MIFRGKRGGKAKRGVKHDMLYFDINPAAAFRCGWLITETASFRSVTAIFGHYLYQLPNLKLPSTASNPQIQANASVGSKGIHGYDTVSVKHILFHTMSAASGSMVSTCRKN